MVKRSQIGLDKVLIGSYHKGTFRYTRGAVSDIQLGWARRYKKIIESHNSSETGMDSETNLGTAFYSVAPILGGK